MRNSVGKTSEWWRVVWVFECNFMMHLVICYLVLWNNIIKSNNQRYVNEDSSSGQDYLRKSEK